MEISLSITPVPNLFPNFFRTESANMKSNIINIFKYAYKIKLCNTILTSAAHVSLFYRVVPQLL